MRVGASNFLILVAGRRYSLPYISGTTAVRVTLWIPRFLEPDVKTDSFESTSMHLERSRSSRGRYKNDSELLNVVYIPSPTVSLSYCQSDSGNWRRFGGGL